MLSILLAEMATFSNAEYADILYFYGLCEGNGAEARREYQRRFPNRRVPNIRVFANTYRMVSESGTVHRNQHNAGAPPRYDPNDEEDILRAFQEDPTTSTHIVAPRLGMSQWKVWVTMNQAEQHPYHYTPVQKLHEDDPLRRMNFCRFILNADMEDATFLRRILWTDESKFNREGITNYHNTHYWAEENPHLTKNHNFQIQFSVNVWLGVINDQVIGPHFLPDILNGEGYEDFLINHLPPLLENVPLNIRQSLIFQQDGCPAHYRLTVREYLDQNFPNRWIGRGGPIQWPARSPDLTPLDFHVWGWMKELVYDREIQTRDELIQRIEEAAVTLRQTFSTRITRAQIRKRARACIRRRGHNFEQDLK